jgi:pilus assembly protein CpaE
MVDHTSQVKLQISNMIIKRKLQDLISSSEGFFIQNESNNKEVDILICEVKENYENDLKNVESLIHSCSAKEVFLTSAYHGSDLLLEVMRSGAKEFLTQPIKEEEVKKALDRFKERMKFSGFPKEKRRRGRVIDVIGSKGGVGTTTVTVNLAMSMLENGAAESVALVDMNTVFGDIPLFLALKPTHHWGELTDNMDRLDETFLMDVLTKHSSGVYVLPSANHLNGNRSTTPEATKVVINMMRKIFDCVIIDSGQSVNRLTQAAMELSDDILLVTLLSLPCLATTNKILGSFSGLGLFNDDQIKVVINRYEKKSDLSLKNAERSIGKKVFWTIPNDFLATVEAINQGKVLSQVASKAEVTKSLEEMANELVKSEKEMPKKRWGLFDRQKN